MYIERHFFVSNQTWHMYSSGAIPGILADNQREGGSALDVGPEGCAGPEGARRRLAGGYLTRSPLWARPTGICAIQQSFQQSPSWLATILVARALSFAGHARESFVNIW